MYLGQQIILSRFFSALWLFYSLLKKKSLLAYQQLGPIYKEYSTIQFSERKFQGPCGFHNPWFSCLGDVHTVCITLYWIGRPPTRLHTSQNCSPCFVKHRSFSNHQLKNIYEVKVTDEIALNSPREKTHMIRQCVNLKDQKEKRVSEQSTSYLMEYEQDADRRKLTSIALGLPIAHRFTL